MSIGFDIRLGFISESQIWFSGLWPYLDPHELALEFYINFAEGLDYDQIQVIDR
jgi:hypothetical protein